MSDTVEFNNLRAANVARQEAWCADQMPDLSFRGNELAGEVGEVCNVIKKLERERLGWRGSRDTVEHLAEELADVVICADLVAITAGIDLEAAVAAKFNATSENVGLPQRLAPASELTRLGAASAEDDPDFSAGWLIHKAGRGWYRPDAQGYTNDTQQAGRYTYEDALSYSHPNGWAGPRDGIIVLHESRINAAISKSSAGVVSSWARQWASETERAAARAGERAALEYAETGGGPVGVFLAGLAAYRDALSLVREAGDDAQ